MVYSNIYFRRKAKISPAVYVLAGLSFCLAVIVSVSKMPKVTRIVRLNLPQNEIVNLMPKQAGFYWETDQAEPGWVLLTNTKTGETSVNFDERDLNGKKNPYLRHYAVASGLAQNTVYEYRILTDKGQYLAPRDKPFVFKTPEETRDVSYGKPVYGRVYKPNGVPAEGAFVLVSFKNAFPLLTFVKASGEWLVPMTVLFDRETRKQVTINDEEQIKIQIIQDKTSTSLTAFAGSAAPVAQTIMLGKDYTLLARENVLAAQTGPAEKPGTSVRIIYPRENAIIPVGKPIIKGLGVAGADVIVNINSKPEFAFRTKVDAKGEWLILPQQNIPAGGYVLTITTIDEKRNKLTMRRNFNIAKSGEQVLGDATGSPTLAPTAASTPTLAPTGTTPVPTAIIPTVPATTPTYAMVSPTITPPRTGGSVAPLFLTSFALLIIGSGLLLVF